MKPLLIAIWSGFTRNEQYDTYSNEQLFLIYNLHFCVSIVLANWFWDDKTFVLRTRLLGTPLPSWRHRFDRGLGGFEMDIRLRDHLAKLFNGQKKSKKDVTGNHRAMAKLLKEAQRLKTVLSANVDFMAQVGERVFLCQ